MSTRRSRAVGGVLALLVFASFRCHAGPDASVPTEGEVADLLADLGHVRAASILLGDADAVLPASVADAWDAVAHYVVTAPGGRTIRASIAVATLRSEPDAQAFFRAFIARHASSAAAPDTLAGRGGSPSATPAGEVYDFRQVYPRTGARGTVGRARLTRTGPGVRLVLASADPDGGSGGPDETTCAVIATRLAGAPDSPGR
jgi:hypothetical protein